MIIVYACTCGKFAVTSLYALSIWVAASCIFHLSAAVCGFMSWNPWDMNYGRDRSRSPTVTVKSPFGSVETKTPPWRITDQSSTDPAAPTAPPAADPTVKPECVHTPTSAYHATDLQWHACQEWAEHATTSPSYAWQDWWYTQQKIEPVTQSSDLQDWHSMPSTEPTDAHTSQATPVSEVVPSSDSKWQNDAQWHELPVTTVQGDLAPSADSKWQNDSQWHEMPVTTVQSEPTGYDLLHATVPDAVASPPPPDAVAPPPPPPPLLNAAQVKQHGGYRIKMAKLAWIVKHGPHPAVFDGWSAMQAAEHVLGDSRLSVDIEKVRMSVQKYRAAPGVVAPGSV